MTDPQIVQIVITKTRLTEDGQPVYKVAAMTATKTAMVEYFVMPKATLDRVAWVMMDLEEAK